MKPFFTCQTALLKALEDAWQTRLFSLFVSASGIIASIAAGAGAARLLSQQHDLLKALLLFLVVLLGLAGSLFFPVPLLERTGCLCRRELLAKLGWAVRFEV